MSLSTTTMNLQLHQILWCETKFISEPYIASLPNRYLLQHCGVVCPPEVPRMSSRPEMEIDNIPSVLSWGERVGEGEVLKIFHLA